MCCKNKSRRSGGCHSRRWNNNNLPLAPGQEPVVVYERRPTLMSMFAQHMAQKREAKRQQNVAFEEPKQRSFLEGDLEDQKLSEERLAQAYWDQKNANMNAEAGAGRGVDHVEARQNWAGENNRLSRMSVGTELPSYGQAMKQ